MFWWAVLGSFWMWLAVGPDGMQMAIGMAGLAMLGLATAKLLDFVAKENNSKKRSQEIRFWKPRQVELRAFARRPRVQK
jgi:hypothetical protein